MRKPESEVSGKERKMDKMSFETEKQYQERIEKIIANGEKEYERIVLKEKEF